MKNPQSVQPTKLVLLKYDAHLHKLGSHWFRYHERLIKLASEINNKWIRRQDYQVGDGTK